MGNKKRAAFLLLFTHKSEEDLDPDPSFSLVPVVILFLPDVSSQKNTKRQQR